MRLRAWTAIAVVAACAAAARGEDPPPAKPRHENKVTPEAKAAIERFTTVAYGPETHGVESASGVVVPFGFQSHERIEFTWTAKDGRAPRATLPRSIQKEMRDADMWTWPFRECVYAGYDAWGLFDYREFDAQVERRDGARVVVMTEYQDGVRDGSDECLLGADGLVVHRVHRAVPGSSSSGFTATYTWTTAGDERCLSAIEIVEDRAAPSTYSCALHYADVAGARLVTSFEVTFAAKDAEPRTCRFFVADLVVNGSKVDLPTPWKHVNVISPEARDAMSAYDRLAYRPAEHGLVSLVAAAKRDDDARATPIRVEFSRPARLFVETPAEVDKPRSAWFGARFDVGFALRLELDGLRLVDGDEFDAATTDGPGARTLVVTTFRDGVETRTDEFTLDARGLPTRRVRSETSSDGDVSTSTVGLAWSAVGDRFRVAGVETQGEASGKPWKKVLALECIDAGGISLPASCTSTLFEGITVTAWGWRLGDVVVNGRRVAFPNPKAHVNDVSPEARIALERYEDLVARPADRGFVSATFALMPAGVRFTVRPPALVWLPYVGEQKRGSELLKRASGLSVPVRFAFGGPSPSDSVERDARFVAENGTRVLVATSYHDGVAFLTTRTTFDDAGLVATMQATNVPPTGSSMFYKFVWEGAGGVRRPSEVELWDGKAPAPLHFAYRFTYVDVAGFHALAAVEERISDGRTASLRVEDLVVDGKPIALPKLPAAGK